MRTVPYNCSPRRSVLTTIPESSDTQQWRCDWHLDNSCLPSYDNAITRKIKSFKCLKFGWHFGEGVPASDEVVDATINLFTQLGLRLNFEVGLVVNALPEINGGVILSYGLGEDFVELLVHSDLSVDLVQERGLGVNYDVIEEEENLDINNIALILSYLKKICNSSEPYISNSMILTKSDSQVTASRTMVEAFPFSKMPVQKERVSRSVNIFPHSTPTLMETL